MSFVDFGLRIADSGPRTADTLEATITEVAARCLRARPTLTAGAIDPDTPFALLGLDSLAAIELAVALEEALGVDVSPDLLAECPDVRALAARFRQGVARVSADDEFDLMMADAILPDEIRPLPRRGSLRHGGRGLEQAEAILLTGATGFLGAALARELIERSCARLICLVRSDGGDPRARLQEQLAAHGVGANVFDSRIRVVEGDLRLARLGLTRDAFDALSRAVDAICHAGAAVNWIAGYQSLRASNVTGTLELLRLAVERAIPVHFVSSLSVCYSSSGPPEVDEAFDPLPCLRGVHLGYAQTKIVAESLVRQAGARGLPVTIYRPALISGDSRSGAFNQEDVLSALIKGCVRMGSAPDLDWQLDCQPVDVVAAAIVRLSGHQGRTFHLSHARPRHWRECVLWMRLYGYAIRLESYHAWLRKLEQETSPSGDPDHPLRALRSFFLERPAGARGLTLPELYEEERRTIARGSRTRETLEATGVTCPALDARLLDTYFAAYVASGHLPAPLESPASTPASSVFRPDTSDLWTPAFFARAIGGGVEVRSVDALATGSDHSIVSELAAWRTGGPSGLFRFRLGLATGGRLATRQVIVKMKPIDRQVIEVGEAVARVCSDAVGEAYATWGHRIGLTASHARELAIYAQNDPRFARHAPAVLGSAIDEQAGRWTLILECVTDGRLMDSVDRPQAWARGHVSRAIDGLAALQAIWFGREAELTTAPWIGDVPSAVSMAEMSDLWSALAEHAAPAFSSWAGPEVASIQRRLIAGIGEWWPDMERGPRTLIHNDFNPRNICLRPGPRALRLCAYDWELATIGTPQRDLAELLCFVLPPDAPGSEIALWVDHHRRALSIETGQPIDREQWRLGFRSSVYDLLVNRLAMYALVHRIRRQTFLPRVVRTWRRIYNHVENC